MRRWKFKTFCLFCVVSVVAMGAITWRITHAQDELSVEEEREKKIVERFVTVLERNPRRGTAFDRIYGHHVEWGTLDAFVKSFRERAENDDKDGIAWMVIGLVESQRGQDAAAADAFAKAEELLTDNAITSYYHAQSLVMIGQPEEAVKAFERAIDRKPQRIDMLEIFQALGRVHQRAQRTEEALEVWTRLEKLFPDDARVQEEIAVTLTEEGQYEAALPRYEALVKLTRDPYRRSVYQMEAAEVKVRLKRASEGIADFEKMLAGLNPDSWLYREVRRKIEEVFLRTDDQDGLAKYYESWLEKHTRDVDAMARLARVLARQARMPEAQAQIAKALELAPSRKDLRLTFISQLVEEQRFGDAIKQYEELDKTDPNNPDYLRDWGKLVLRDKSVPKEERFAAAEKVWRRLTDARPDDALIATQVADLFRHANMTEQALALYEKAVELAPGEPQYREYLGEYYHILKRKDDALATWAQIAAGDNRTATNVARLAEVLAGFGYLDEGVKEMAAAVELDKKDFSLPIRAAIMHTQAELYEESLAFLDAADKLAASREETNAVLDERLKVYQLDGSLADRTEKLSEKLADAGSATADEYVVLARHYEATRQWPNALEAINKALELDPKSVASLAASARVHERSGNLEEAADRNRELAKLDRRFRTDYLTNVARLETQLGRTEQALAAGRELIKAAPGNTENYEFFSQLCFQLGEQEEGLKALRRALRVNPTEPQLAMTLAEALSNQFRTDEAIELYWQAFDRSGDLDSKLAIIEKHTELYLQTNRFDRLLERLERERQDEDQRRVMTICLAQAFQSAGDYGEARQELESLLNEDTRDTQLLQQLSKLAENEGDVEAAMKFQEQLALLAPGTETEYKLADLYTKNGRDNEAAAIMRRLTTREQDPVKLARNLGKLLKDEQWESALAVLETKLREEPESWELRYKQAVALTELKSDRAKPAWDAILAMDVDDGQLSEAEIARRKQQHQQMKRMQQRQGTTIAASHLPEIVTESTRFDAYQQAYAVQRALSIGQYADYYSYGRQQQQQFWVPTSFGSARMASMGWLLKMSQTDEDREELLTRFREPAEADDATERAIWDWLYMIQVSNDMDSRAGAHKIVRRLAESGDSEMQYLYLTIMPQRAADQYGNTPGQNGQADATPPLSDEDLELVLRCYRELTDPETKKRDKFAERYANPMSLWSTVAAELKRAKRDDEEQKLYEEVLAFAEKEGQTMTIIQLASQREDWDRVMTMFDKWVENEDEHQNFNAYSFAQLLGKRGEAKAHDDVLRIVDASLDAQIKVINKRIKDPKWQRQQQRNQRQAMSAMTMATPFGGGGSTYLYSFYGGQQLSSQVSFPTPSVYFDQGSMSIVRNAYDIFKRNDVVSDVFEHFQKRYEAADEENKLYADYHLCALYWWNDEKEKSLKHFTAVAEALPDDKSMQMQVINLKVTNEEYDEALAMLDAMNPRDHKSLSQRETMALDLAVRLGDNERAKKAAERLFGLRLGADEQLALASQMRRLGMHEHADAVMSRAGKQAGNRMSALVTLMNQHLAQGNGDVAVQIAHRILRRTSGSAGSSNSSRYNPNRNSENSSARQSAIQTLARTGNLKNLIARAEQQIENSPNSTRLYQKLAELYTASGKRDEALKLQGKIIELRPNDATLRYQFAEQLERAGKHSEACDQYAAAIKTDARMLYRDYYRVFRTFRTAKRSEELVSIFEEIDMKVLRRYYIVMNLVQDLLRQEDQREIGMRLFQKAWHAFPNDRASMLGYVHQQEIWQLPEMYEMAREAFLPTEQAIARDPWVGLHARSYSQNGIINGALSYMMKGIGKSEKFKELREEVAAAVEKNPKWHGGKAVLAVFDAKQGRPEEAKDRLTALLADDAAKTMGGDVRRVIAQEIEEMKEFHEIAIQLFEESLNDTRNGLNEFQYTAGPRLARLYKEVGRRDEARHMVIESTKLPSNRGYDPDYAIYQRVENYSSAAQQMAELDFPVDALRMYREMIMLAESPQGKASRYYSSMDHYIRRGREQMQKALDKVSGDQLASVAKDMLGPPTGDDVTDALDLMVAVTVEKDQSRRMESLLFKFLSEEKNLTDDVKAAVVARLAELAEQHPDDLNVGIATVLYPLLTKQDEQVGTALTSLVSLVERAPLEAIEDGKRPNSRQRIEAQKQTALWLVASQALQSEEHREAGAVLAERAVGAARRQLDNSHALAMLQEWGQVALKGKDVEKAKELWGEALALSLNRKKIGNSDRLPPVTQSQYRAALGVAKATATALPDLSLQAVREALATGPPITDAKPGMQQARNREDPDAMARFMGEIATEMQGVTQKWHNTALPKTDIYDTLASVVFCQTRPGEIMLYHRPVSQSGSGRPVSVGDMLVTAAVRAKKVDEFRKEVESRQANVTTQVAARTLLAKLGIAAKDNALAIEQLEALGTQLQAQPIPTNIDIACHAAIPALDGGDEMLIAALPVVDIATKSLGLNLNSGIEALAYKVAKVHFKAGNGAEAQPHVETYLQNRMRRYATSSADYAQYIQKRDLAQVARDAAQYHHFDLAFVYLARAADTPSTRRGEPGLRSQVWHFIRYTGTMPPEERYKYLHQWSMPNENRRTVRMVAAFNPGRYEPDVNVRTALRNMEGSTHDVPEWMQHDFGAISNLRLLIETAQQTGQLDALTKEAAVAASEEVVGAKLLHTLCLVAAGDRTAGEPLVREAVNDAQLRYDRKKGESWQQKPNFEDFLVLQSCLRSREFIDIGRDFANLMLKMSRHRGGGDLFMTHVNYEWAMAPIRQLPEEQRDQVTALKLWSPGTPPGHTVGDNAPALWAAHEGQITHRSGPEHDKLYFRYPLTGTFEFSFDGYTGDFATGELGYGGLVAEPIPWQGKAAVWPVSHHEDLRIPKAVEAWANFSRKMSVKVTPESIKFFVNGHLYYEEKEPSPTSPWLHLLCLDHRETTFRNGKFVGTPVIPREVPLVSGNRLDGWSGQFFKLKLPHRITPEPKPKKNQKPRQNDWWAEDGEIRGRRNRNATNNDAQSLLSYVRPLASGDTVRYEFYHEPFKTHVHPAVGRLAFILQPKDVRLHFVVQPGNADGMYNLWTKSILYEKGLKQGPDEVPLKLKDWNQVELSLVGDTVRIKLNDVLVCERALPPSNDRRFGLFHMRQQTEAQVRNVVLTGDWPESLSADDLAKPFASEVEDAPAAVLAARHDIVREQFLARYPYELWLAARDEQDAEQRFAMLRDWVLPNEQHPTFRVQGGFTPGDVPPPVATKAAGGLLEADSSWRNGGSFFAPVVDLVRLAKEQGKLDALSQHVEQTSINTPFAKRSQLALQLLIAIAREDYAGGKALLGTIYQQVKQLPGSTPLHERWPEVVSIMAAADHPQLVDQARGLADFIAENQRNFSHKWHLLTYHVRAVARWKQHHQDSRRPWKAPLELTQWKQTDDSTAAQRAQGHGPGAWRYERGEVEHYSGSSNDTLFFNSPLEGDFEVHYEQTTHGWRETMVGYHTTGFDALHTGNAVLRYPVGRKSQQTKLPKKITDFGPWISCRLVVKDSKITWFANGDQLVQADLPKSVDPWLYLRTVQPQMHGRIRNLRIVGSPTIPDEIELMPGTRIRGWSTLYFGETIGGNNGSWAMKGRILLGRLFGNKRAKGHLVESAFVYHRPLFEDGELRYDFFYKPGETEVHPSLDKAVFLLHENGVKLHWRTDGAWDRTGLAPDNEFELPDGGALVDKLPLKAEAFNTLRLKLAGDVVTLNLNNTDIARYTLEPNNMRRFGFFRYSSETTARIRNIFYRGNWPKELPPVAEQELAYPPEGPAVIPADTLAKKLHVKFSDTSIDKLKQAGIVFSGDEQGLTINGDGAKLTLVDNIKGNAHIGFNVPAPVGGDFEVTLGVDTYDIAKETTKTWFSLTADLQNPAGRTSAWLDWGLEAPGRLIVGPTRFTPWPDGSERGIWQHRPGPLDVTHLRLVRQGQRVTYLYKKKGEETFRVINSWHMGDADTQQLQLKLYAGVDNAKASVILRDLTIRAEQIGPQAAE